MSDSTPEIAPTAASIACDLKGFTPEERADHMERARRLRRSVSGFERSSDGLTITFDSTAEREEVEAFADFEQQCCSFLSGGRIHESGTRGAEAGDAELDGEGVALSFDTAPEKASAWIGLFLSMDGSPTGREDSGGDVMRSPSSSRLPVLAAAGLGLACLLPLVGTMLVARGLLPEAWNVGEGAYLLVGIAVLAVWAAWRSARRIRSDPAMTARDDSKAKGAPSGCGC